jgi:hypothetical protein
MDVSTPPSLDLACPQAKTKLGNMTTGLWSEVSIIKIWTRSITFTKAQIIIDSNFPLYDTDLQ